MSLEELIPGYSCFLFTCSTEHVYWPLTLFLGRSRIWFMAKSIQPLVIVIVLLVRTKAYYEVIKGLTMRCFWIKWLALRRNRKCLSTNYRCQLKDFHNSKITSSCSQNCLPSLRTFNYHVKGDISIQRLINESLVAKAQDKATYKMSQNRLANQKQVIHYRR